MGTKSQSVKGGWLVSVRHEGCSWRPTKNDARSIEERVQLTTRQALIGHLPLASPSLLPCVQTIPVQPSPDSAQQLIPTFALPLPALATSWRPSTRSLSSIHSPPPFPLFLLARCRFLRPSTSNFFLPPHNPLFHHCFGAAHVQILAFSPPISACRHSCPLAPARQSAASSSSPHR